MAGAVRRHLLTVGRKALGRPAVDATAEDLVCGHPAHQAHARFHPFHAMATRKLVGG